MKTFRIIELFDDVTDVLRYEDQAKKVYTTMRQSYRFDWNIELVDGELMYKVVIELNCEEIKETN